MNEAGPTSSDVASLTTHPGPAASEAAYQWMDLMRWLAATIVVISHARDLIVSDYDGAIWSIPFYLATGLGHSAVILFFVLSGFWIAKTVLRRVRQSPDGFWRIYLIDRMARLWIVLLPALLLGYSLDALGVTLFPDVYLQTDRYHSFAGVSGSMDWMTWLGNVFFQQSLAVPALGSNGPLWSLAYEFWFYLWFPALLLVRRRPSPWLLSLGMAALFPKLAAGFLCWLAGAAVASLDGVKQWTARPFLVLIVTGLLSAAVFVVASVAPGSLWLWDLAIALTFAAFLFSLLRAPVAFPRALVGLARFGARSSFSLYAIHFPLMLFAIVGLGLERGPLNVVSVGVITATTVLCSIAAIGFSQLTEARTPFIRQWLSRRLKLGSRKPV